MLRIGVCRCTNTCVHLHFFYSVSSYFNFAPSKENKAVSSLFGSGKS